MHHPPCLVASRFRLLAGAVFSPPPQEDGRRRAHGGQPLTLLAARAQRTHCRATTQEVPVPTDEFPLRNPSPDRADLAARIYSASHLTGTFTLRSGVVSNEYFDKYMFESDPLLLRDIATACVPLVPPGMDALAGLELGGIPLATMISQVGQSPDPLRAQGGQDLRHLPPRRGRRRSTASGSASSKTWSPRAGRSSTPPSSSAAQGAILGPVICVIDRESGGAEKLAAQGLELHPLFLMHELKA